MEHQCGRNTSKSTLTENPFSIYGRGRNIRGAYKCLVFVSRSSPGEVADEIGIGPER